MLEKKMASGRNRHFRLTQRKEIFTVGTILVWFSYLPLVIIWYLWTTSDKDGGQYSFMYQEDSSDSGQYKEEYN